MISDAQEHHRTLEQREKMDRVEKKKTWL